MRFTEEANGVIAVRLFERAFCRRVVSRLTQIRSWRDAEVLNPGEEGEEISVRRSEVRAASILATDDNLEIYRRFDATLRTDIVRLIHRVWNVEFSEFSGANVVRYRPGGYYRPHTDSGIMARDRYFTVICYLNDDFQGGATGFPLIGHQVKPQTGKAIIFPARYMHCGEPVIRGEKYIVVSWALGPTPIDWL